MKSLVSKLVVLVFFCFSSGKSMANLGEYTLGAGDLVNITVFGEEDLFVETRVSNVGVIKYPFLGELQLIGKTVNEVERIIDEGLRGDYLINPTVSVSVIEYRPFFIDGEVKRPGGYSYQPGLSFDKAVALAGGYTERANKAKVNTKRIIDGREESLELSVGDIVLPGDIITIPSRFF
ncbi:polysaccharide biosynthesis/export family protein [Agaribacter flavus]|uniref:Polysaccharide biosynthesis/export family protein n=1 Tax=Agaribacter flavus TaxID=1902781 RepID=A0ABV7FMD8_9ALTE